MNCKTRIKSMVSAMQNDDRSVSVELMIGWKAGKPNTPIEKIALMEETVLRRKFGKYGLHFGETVINDKSRAMTSYDQTLRIEMIFGGESKMSLNIGTSGLDRPFGTLERGVISKILESRYAVIL